MANRRSIICEGQYKAYLHVFPLKRAVSEATGESVKGIGGRQIATGTVMIQIPLKDLGLVIDVDFMFIRYDTYPPLLAGYDNPWPGYLYTGRSHSLW